MPLACCRSFTMRLSVVLVLLPLSTSAGSSSGRVSWKSSLPGKSWQDNNDDNNDEGWKGAGREFNLFGSRGGEDSRVFPPPSSRVPPTTRTSSSSSSRPPRPSYYNNRRAHSQQQSHHSSIFQHVREWWAGNVKNMPQLQCRVEPTTTLKIRKTFRPLKTIVTLGADFNTQLGVWQFRSSWEDSIIGGKLTLSGRELQLTKSWQLSVGAVEDLVTRLRFRAAVDLGTWKAFARVGFRTERLSPINMVEGFTLRKQLPLDGTKGHVKLEVKANFALPEPEIEYSTESHRSVIGMGDIQVNIDELNLLLDY